jgi:hypothetical protein
MSFTNLPNWQHDRSQIEYIEYIENTTRNQITITKREIK